MPMVCDHDLFQVPVTRVFLGKEEISHMHTGEAAGIWNLARNMLLLLPFQRSGSV